MTASERGLKLLGDAKGAAGRIVRFTHGRDYEYYHRDDMLRSAVERQFEITGEAFNNLRKHDPGLAALIPDLPRIIGFRNVLSHGYESLDDSRVRDAVQTAVPALLSSIELALRGTEQPPPGPPDA